MAAKLLWTGNKKMQIEVRIHPFNSAGLFLHVHNLSFSFLPAVVLSMHLIITWSVTLLKLSIFCGTLYPILTCPCNSMYMQ